MRENLSSVQASEKRSGCQSLAVFKFHRCLSELRKQTSIKLLNHINKIIVVEHTRQEFTVTLAKRRYRVVVSLFFAESALRVEVAVPSKKLRNGSIASRLPKSTADNKFRTLH